jgi:hypothetical protein
VPFWSPGPWRAHWTSPSCSSRDTYPCLTDALTALTDATEVPISAGQVGLLPVTGRLDDPELTQLRGQSRVLFDTGTR